MLDALAAVDTAGLGARDDFYWTLHAVFVKRHEHSVLFDQAFRIFFRRRGYLDQLLAMMLPQAPNQTPQPPQAGATRVQEALFSGLDDKLKKQQEIELDTRMTVSDREVLQRKDFAQMTNAEIAAAKAAIKRLVLPLAEVRTRRLAPHARGTRDRHPPHAAIELQRRRRFHRFALRRPEDKTSAPGGAPRHFGFDEPVQPDFSTFSARADRCAKAREHVSVRHPPDQCHARAARTRSRRCPCRLFGQRARLVGRNADRVVVACFQ